MILAVLVGVLGSLLSGEPELWITRALVVLVAASPCALAIAVPVTVVSAIGAASKFGVVVKSGAAFERFGGIRHLAVDKTGTLTRNEPTVARVVTVAGATELMYSRGRRAWRATARTPWPQRSPVRFPAHGPPQTLSRPPGTALPAPLTAHVSPWEARGGCTRVQRPPTFRQWNPRG